MASVTLPLAQQYEDAVQRGHGLAQIFYHQVERLPSKVAVFDDQTTITYHELHLHACQLACQLSKNSVVKEEPVGIIMQHGIYGVIAQMAILYVGGTCVPVDPALPEEQLCGRLQRLGTKCVLVDQANSQRPLPFISIVADVLNRYALPSLEQAMYPVETDLSHRSHVIHTSGTTSEPKAVQILACSILEVAYHAPFEPLLETDVVAHVNSTSFDVSLYDIWASLLQGASIAVLSKAIVIDPPALAAHIERLGITILPTTTALLNLAAATYPRAFSRLRICMIGGEAANMAAIATILREGPPSMLINAYGPTECCVFSLAHRVTLHDIDASCVPVGLPIGCTSAFIVDSSGEPSEEGELLIGGPGVSPGYVGLPEKTAAAFITSSRLTDPSGTAIRLYCTGDIVRRLAGGEIEYVGRQDHQVKIRGFRVELEAVENALLTTGHFSDAVALKVEPPQKGAGSMLVAYATPSDASHPCDPDMALTLLKKALPEYMIPHLEVLPQLPLNGHAKVDRKHLAQLFSRRWKKPQPTVSAKLNGDNTALDTRSKLATIWSSIVATSRFPYEDEDDFFSLGGTSLQASLLIDQIRRNFDMEISLLTLYSHSTFAGLAAIIDSCQGSLLDSVRDDSDMWLADTRLGDEIELPPGPVVDWRRNDEGRIFLTGATGFVGAFLLADLLRLPGVSQVCCLVRAESVGDGMQRLRTALSKYGLWEDQFTDKIRAVPGCLEDRYLGLGLALFNELAGWASTVFHLGARVNYTQPYSLHRPANTIGTVNVVQFSRTRRSKSVHYVSSISCFGPTGSITGAKTVREDEPLLLHLKALPYDHGYAQSQWVVDQLLLRLIDRGFPISIYRPGFITGHSETGACNPDDFFSRLILACRDIGCYPDLPNQRKEFVPVDYLNATILHIAAKSGSVGRAYHIVPPARHFSIDMNNTMKLVSDCDGSQIRQLSYQDWLQRLASASHARLQPLLPMLAEKVHGGKTRWELYENMPIYSMSNTMNALADFPGGLEFPALDKALIQKYLNHLIRV